MAVRPKSIVPKVGEPDIDESYIRQQDVVVLKTLLIDRTMTALNAGSSYLQQLAEQMTRVPWGLSLHRPVFVFSHLRV